MFRRTYRLHHQGDKIEELGTTSAVTNNRRILRRNTRAIRCNILEEGILLNITGFTASGTYHAASPVIEHNLQVAGAIIRPRVHPQLCLLMRALIAIRGVTL
jgi:hypothetical protein